MIAILWTLIALVLLAWTGFAALLHGVLSLTPSAVAEIKPLLDELPLAAWFETWLPGWQTLAEIVLNLGSHLVSLTGAFLPWLVAALWAFWGLGALLLLLLGGLIHAVVRAGQRAEAAHARAATLGAQR